MHTCGVWTIPLLRDLPRCSPFHVGPAIQAGGQLSCLASLESRGSLDRVTSVAGQRDKNHMIESFHGMLEFLLSLVLHASVPLPWLVALLFQAFLELV